MTLMRKDKLSDRDIGLKLGPPVIGRYDFIKTEKGEVYYKVVYSYGFPVWVETSSDDFRRNAERPWGEEQ